jgi:antitoxin PrlF
MPKSKITSKGQTTVPRSVRDRLGVGANDVLRWEVLDGAALVRPATQRFLSRRGSITTGRGSAVEDVKRSRRQRGTEGQQ